MLKANCNFWSDAFASLSQVFVVLPSSYLILDDKSSNQTRRPPLNFVLKNLPQKIFVKTGLVH